MKKELDSDIERRYFQSEVRSMDDPTTVEPGSDGRWIGGYGAVFNRYTDMYWFLEVVDPGAFENADMSECACLHNHLDHLVLGRMKNKTLELNTDATGLLYRCDVAKTNAGNDVVELVRRGDIYQSSFGFTVRRQIWEEVDRTTLVDVVDAATLDKLSYGGKVEVRRIMEVGKLYDVSPVTFPAYADTTVAQVRRDEWRAANGKGATMDVREKKAKMDMDLRLNEMRLMR